MVNNESMTVKAARKYGLSDAIFGKNEGRRA